MTKGEQIIERFRKRFVNKNDNTVSNTYLDYLVCIIDREISELEGILENKLIGPEHNVYNAADAYWEIGKMLNVPYGGSVIETVRDLIEKVNKSE